MTIPALHLWWRYTWRMALIPLVILLFGTFSLAIFVMILAHVAPYVIEFFALLLVIGGRYGTVSPPSLFSAMWVLLAPFLAIYGIWLFQDRLLSEPFQYRGQFWSFRIVEGSTALTYPLAGKTAFALWWAFLWRDVPVFVSGISNTRASLPPERVGRSRCSQRMAPISLRHTAVSMVQVRGPISPP